MTSIQSLLIQLLGDFGALCEKAGVTWCTADRLAWASFKHHKFNDASYDAFVMVKEQDVPTLLACAAKALPANRLLVEAHPETEGTGVGGKGIRLYFVATDSTNVYLPYVREPYPAAKLSIRTLTACDEGFQGIDPWGKPFTVATDLTATSEWRRFENTVLPIPSDYEAYFTVLAGTGWRKTDYTGPINKPWFGFYSSTKAGYEELFARMEAEDFDGKSFTELMNGYEEFLDGDYDKARRNFDSDLKILKINTQRLRLCQKYLPVKAQLLAAWEAGQKELVTKALAEDYFKELKKMHSKYGVALHFDDELFDLALAVLREQDYKDVDMLAAEVPADHRANPLSAVLTPYLGL